MAEPRPLAMSFISEAQVEENKASKGERPEDGTLTVDKPLYELLKEQKEKKDAEWKEKHRNLPPKALDEEEMEFLETLTKHQKEQELEAAREEQEAMAQFQTALLSRTVKVEDPAKHVPAGASAAQTKEAPSATQKRKQPLVPVKPAAFKVVIQPKKPKADSTAKSAPAHASSEPTPGNSARPDGPGNDAQDRAKGMAQSKDCAAPGQSDSGPDTVLPTSAKGDGEKVPGTGLSGLMAYGSDDDEED